MVERLVHVRDDARRLRADILSGRAGALALHLLEIHDRAPDGIAPLKVVHGDVGLRALVDQQFRYVHAAVKERVGQGGEALLCPRVDVGALLDEALGGLRAAELYG